MSPESAPVPLPDTPRATLVDVAREAGVSLKTASRAVNGEPRVADETRRRVLAAASELGFQLNPMASLLRRGIQSRSVGFITGDLANPFYSRLAKGIERELRRADVEVTIASTDEDPSRERELIDELVHRRVRALIVVSSSESHAGLAAVQERGIPVVFVDRPAIDLLADSVVADDRAGAQHAVAHLVAHGHQRIGFVGDFSRLPTHRARREGYLDALRAAGIEARDALLREGSHDADAARATVLELLTAPDPPTALFTSNNRVTIGAIGAFRDLGRAPALVGFDDFDLADVLGVTVVAHDVVEMGRRAAALALAGMTAREPRGETDVLAVRLIERGSGEVPPGGSWL